MTSFFKILFATGMLVSAGIPAHTANIDNKWFLHEFGELRAYHGDFLNVCDGYEFRSCRTVQYGFEAGKNDTFFGNSRLSIARILDNHASGGTTGVGGPPQYTIEIYIRNLADNPRGPFTLSINGEIFQLSDDKWNAGSPEGYNVAETISITNPILVDKLIASMRKGDSLRVLYDGWKEERFQLRGISKALDAIEKQIAVPNS